jgi:hypothetical protein
MWLLLEAWIKTWPVFVVLFTPSHVKLCYLVILGSRNEHLEMKMLIGEEWR